MCSANRAKYSVKHWKLRVYSLKKMAAAQRFTTDQVLAFLLEDDFTNETADRREETFEDYVGVILADSEDDRSDAVEVPSADSNDSNSGESDDERSAEEANRTEDKDIGTQDVYPNTDNTESMLSVANPDQDQDDSQGLTNPWESSDTADSSGESDESILSSDQLSSDDSERSEGSESEQELGMEQDTLGADQGCGYERGRGRGRGRSRGRGRGRGVDGRSQSRGRGWGRGRSREVNGRGQSRGHGRGRNRGRSRGRGRGRARDQQDLLVTGYKDLIPKEAVSIDQKDTAFVECSDFLPIRDPGPHLPFPEQQCITELDLFSLYITDGMLEHFVEATNSYAESKKESKRGMYRQFKLVPLTKEELLRYLGVLLLLSINSVRSYRQAWDRKSSQLLVRLHDLMSRNRFEAISAFFHVVTPGEESSNDPLKTICSMHKGVKKGMCIVLSTPL